MRYHRWNEDNTNAPSKPTSPLPPKSPKQLFSHSWTKEGTKEHTDPEEKAGLNYRTVLGELMYFYVYCIPDIEYGVTIPSKLSSTLSDYQ